MSDLLKQLVRRCLPVATDQMVPALSRHPLVEPSLDQGAPRRGAAVGAPYAGLWPWKTPPGAAAPSPPRQGAIVCPASSTCQRVQQAADFLAPRLSSRSRRLQDASRRCAIGIRRPWTHRPLNGDRQLSGRWARIGLSPGPGHVLAAGFGTCEGKGRTSRPGRTGTRAARAARLEWPDATPRSRDAILPANSDSGPRARGGGMQCGPDVRERPL